MKIVRDEKLLKQRVENYLWRDKSKTVSALRLALKKHFSDFDNVSIIGGMIRDLALNGKAGFRSDVDLVIAAPSSEVGALASHLSAKPNRFGGYGFATERWKIDFWALEDTWAIKAGHIRAACFDDLLYGTFFDWDSVLYDIRQRRIHVRDEYFEILQSRTLGVNLVQTPSAVGNAVRAVRRILSWDLRASDELLDFIDDVLITSDLDLLINYERKKYSASFCAQFASGEALLGALKDVNTSSSILGKSPRQLELPGLL